MIKDKDIIFGPIPSRRLGISLGIDLIPYKTCSLDCVYCECGETDKLSSERKEFYPSNDVIKIIEYYLGQYPEIDYITFAGSGEPTLYKPLGTIISFIKENYPKYKIALITNSTLLYDPAVREEIQNIDLLIPSVDAISEEVYQKINRPVPGITSQMILNGLLELKKSFKGEIWLETFIVPGINDINEELNQLVNYTHKLGPTKIQLNTLDRPGTESWVEPLEFETLKAIKDRFKSSNVEIIAKQIPASVKHEKFQKVQECILKELKSGELDYFELHKSTNIKLGELGKHLEILKAKDLITEKNGKYLTVV